MPKLTDRQKQQKRMLLLTLANHYKTTEVFSKWKNQSMIWLENKVKEVQSAERKGI